MVIKEFFNFWVQLFVYPKNFFQNNWPEASKKEIFLIVALIIFGIGNGIDRLDKQLTKYDLKGELDQIEYLNNWIVYWAIAIVAGILGGYIWYLVGGWFFNVRLKWSKGTGDLNKSKFIYLFSGFVASLNVVLVTIVATFIQEKPYAPEEEFRLWDVFTIFLLVFFMYYSVYVSYTGVKTITDAEKNRARIWFLVLPVIIYTILLISAIGFFVALALGLFE